MTVDDGFSVLEAGRAEMGTKHSSKAIEVVRVPLAKVIPNPTSHVKHLMKMVYRIWRHLLPNMVFCSRFW